MEKRNAGAEAVQERGVGEEVEENAAEAFVFEHESEEESPKGARRSKRRGGGTRAARDPPGENRSDKPQAKGTVPVGKSTGLADFEREHYAATVRKLEKEKDALEGLLQDKVAAVAHLSAERKGLVGEKDGLAQQLVQAEQRWAAARDEASRVKEERGALQRELEEVRR